ncbi:hypothetical protein YC2023_067635 [Brassica napus]
MASDNASSHTHSQAPTVDINSPFVFNSLLVLPSSPAPLIDPLVDISLAASDEISYSITKSLANAVDSESSNSSIKPVVKIVKGKHLCDKGWEFLSLTLSVFGIADYSSTPLLSISLLTSVPPEINFKESRKSLPFLVTFRPGHVGSKTSSSGYGVVTGGPLAWGL